MKKAYKDPRPIGMGVLGSRVAGVRVADGKYKLITKKGKSLIYFIPDRKKNETK